MGPTWVLSAPGRPHVSPMNFAIRGLTRPVLRCSSGDWSPAGGCPPCQLASHPGHLGTWWDASSRATCVCKQWRHINAMASQITGKWIVYSTTRQKIVKAPHYLPWSLCISENKDASSDGFIDRVTVIDTFDSYPFPTAVCSVKHYWLFTANISVVNIQPAAVLGAKCIS